MAHRYRDQFNKSCSKNVFLKKRLADFSLILPIYIKRVYEHEMYKKKPWGERFQFVV